jgi:3',5'-cyclic AMP phosphodiesterase CpdA
MNSSQRNIIATARTVRAVLDRPEATEAIEKVSQVALTKPAPSEDDSLRAGAAIALLGSVRASIEKAQAELGDDVMAMPDADDPKAREAAVLLSMLAEGEHGTVSTEPLPQGLEAKFDTSDWKGWATVAVEKLKHWRKHDPIRPPVRTALFPNHGRVAILGDWGTNLYGAPICAGNIAKDAGRYAMLLHLGDIYYSGTPNETKERFLERWPHRTDDSLIRRALNGNHEMYSGGFAYYDEILPAFDQWGSYFALVNDHWLLVGLDTGHVEHDMDEIQIKWLNSVLDLPETREKKLVFFSHHQLFSRLNGQGTKLADETKLGKMLKAGRVHAWYWGHEHRCCIYDPHPGYGDLLARCIGHSGMPETREKVKDWPVERTINALQDSVQWKRFASISNQGGGVLSPSGLVLDGRNRYISGEEEKFAPHGYAVLSFDGPDLVEQVLTPDAVVIHEQKVG